MAAIPAVVGAALIGTAGSLATAIIAKPKVPKAAVAGPRMAAQPRTSSALRDAILARRGTRDNQRTGMGGAEAGAGLKTKLGS